MKKNYLRLPFAIKIVLLTSLLLAGKFSKNSGLPYTSEYSPKIAPLPDSIPSKTYQNRALIEYVNWASER